MTRFRISVRSACLFGAANLLLLTGTPALAQDDDLDDGDGDAIVVLGERLEGSVPVELEKYGSRLEVVDGKLIDEAGFVDTGQALQALVPGLYVAPKNGAFDYVNVSLLGSRTSEVLFLVDGVRIGNRLYTGTTPLDTLPSSMIERVEVLKGGQGLYYGTQAVGGIVNVITKGFTSDFDGAVEGGIDTNEGYHVNGYLRGGANDHYFVAYASHDEADGFQPFRDEDYQPSATDRARSYDVTTFGLKYAYEPTDAFRLSASYQHTDATLDFAKAEDAAEAFNTRNEEIASLKIDWSPSETVDIYLKGYWHDWDSTYTEFDNVLGADGMPTGAVTVSDDHSPWVFEDRGINLLGEFHASEQVTLAVGYDFQRYNGMDAVFLIGSQNESVHAPFAQIKLDLGQASLAAGVRHNMPSDGQDKTVWNVTGKLDLDDETYLRGMVGTSFRLPDAYELYVIDPCCETGNPNLVGEGSFNAELGIGHSNGAISIEAMGFYRRVEDLIGITFDLPAYPDGFLVNSDDKTRVWGGELVVQAQLSRNFGVVFDYTHTEAEIVGTSQQIQDVPRDIAKLILTGRSSNGRFGATAALNYVGEVYDSVSGGIGRVEHGDYLVADLSGFYYLDSDRRHRIGIRLENLFDTDYATRVTRVRRDIVGTSYPAFNVGTPFTFHATYRLTI